MLKYSLVTEVEREGQKKGGIWKKFSLSLF